MRYLFLLLTFTISCGDDSAKPKRQKDDQDTVLDLSIEDDMTFEDMDLEGEDLGTPCSPLDCRRDELINMIQVKREYEYASLGGFELEPQPFEFRNDMGN